MSKKSPVPHSQGSRSASLVKRLDAWLKEHRPDYYRLLNPGVSAAELKVFEEELGAKLPRAFRELYLWRDGQRDHGLGSLRLVWNQTFMPLARVRSTWKEFNALKETSWALSPTWWNELWVPFL